MAIVSENIALISHLKCVLCELVTLYLPLEIEKLWMINIKIDNLTTKDLIILHNRA